jgi:hypothetical protein
MHEHDAQALFSLPYNSTNDDNNYSILNFTTIALERFKSK